ADQSGVQLAAHPDDPPMPTMRGQPRLVYQPHMYQRLLDLCHSRCNASELCVGTLAEMTEGDVYDAVDSYSRQGKIAYLHLRNVTGKGPPLPRDLHRRRRCGYDPYSVYSRAQPLRRCDHSGSCSANVLRSSLACRDGSHFGVHLSSKGNA